MHDGCGQPDLLLSSGLQLGLLLLLEAGDLGLGLLHAPGGLNHNGCLLGVPVQPPTHDCLHPRLPANTTL